MRSSVGHMQDDTCCAVPIILSSMHAENVGVKLRAGQWDVDNLAYRFSFEFGGKIALLLHSLRSASMFMSMYRLLITQGLTEKPNHLQTAFVCFAPKTDVSY